MYKNFEHLLQQYKVTPYKVAKEAKVSQTALSNWKKGKHQPSYETLSKIANYFDVTVDYLMNGEDSENVEKYHFDEETAQMVQEMYENKDMRVLFKTARNAKPEDLKIVNDMLIALMKKENPDYDEGC